MAEPPLVLPETFALPEVEVWLFALTTVMLLLLVEFQVLLLLTLAWLVDPGPVVFSETLSPLLKKPAGTPPPVALLTATVLEVLLLFPALPLVAEPPLVLPETLAEPEVEPWVLALVKPSVLLFCWLTVLLLLTLAWLVEPGPVVPTVTELAAATPIPRPMVAMLMAA